MDKKQYIKSLTTLLYFKNVPTNEKHTEFLFNLLKNDFTNEEFNKACEDICKREELYNKYPDPKLFYDRKQKNEPDMVSIVEGMFYLDDTMPEYKPYLEGMTDNEVHRVWKWIMDNKYGQDVTREWVIERIKQFKKPRIEKPETLKIQGIESAIKRIEEDK